MKPGTLSATKKNGRRVKKPMSDIEKELKEQLKLKEKMEKKYQRDLENAQKKINKLQDSTVKEKEKHSADICKRKEEIQKLKIMNEKARIKIKEIQSLSNTKKFKKLLDAERRRSRRSREDYMTVQSLLSKDQEQMMMEAKPWRHCEICTEEFKAPAHFPHVLSCGHTYCYTCLKKLLEEYGTYLRCPVDRKLHHIPEADIWKLPVNWLVLHM